jgi:hypothetical protein
MAFSTTFSGEPRPFQKLIVIGSAAAGSSPSCAGASVSPSGSSPTGASVAGEVVQEVTTMDAMTSIEISNSNFDFIFSPF